MSFARKRTKVKWVALLGVVASMLSCERQAPGEEECLDYAMLTLRINDPRLLAVPGVFDKLDALVVKCLTTPFDKQLIQCVKTRSMTQSCFYDFQDRDRRRGLIGKQQ